MPSRLAALLATMSMTIAAASLAGSDLGASGASERTATAVILPAGSALLPAPSPLPTPNAGARLAATAEMWAAGHAGENCFIGADAFRIGPSDGLQLVHYATFANGSLESALDPLNIGPLKFGSTGEPGINATWMPLNGDYLVGVTRPAGSTGLAQSAGIFAFPVEFGPGSVVGLRGTFIAPTGPHDRTDLWAVAVIARPGGIDPLSNSARIGVTLQVSGGGARLNVPGAAVPANLPNLPQEVYDAIFDPVDPQPFVLELLVDRVDGRGRATLKVGEAKYAHEFESAVFRPDSGPVITNVGANVALANGSGKTISVRIRDFQIYSAKRIGLAPASAPCAA
jgi:hypothetical protein